MGKCIVTRCRNRTDVGANQDTKISYFSFPKEPRVKIAWVNAIKKSDDWIPSSNSRICSAHFEEKYIVRHRKSCSLVKDAIPTINLPDSMGIDKATQTFNMQPMEEFKDVEENCLEISSEDELTVLLSPRPISSFSTNLTSSTSRLSSSLSFYSDLSSHSRSAVTSPSACNYEQEFVSFSDEDSPKKKRLKCEIIGPTENKLVINRLQQNKRRYPKKIVNLRIVLDKLYEEKLLNNDERLILKYFEDNLSMSELFLRKVSKKKISTTPTYSPALRAFALTLHYYSPRAYEYVREVFDTCLPHLETLYKWYQAINGNPGFTQEAFQALRMKSEHSNERILVGLMLDEMTIQQHVEWDGENYHGYVDYGANADMDLDNAQVSKEAFVFLCNAIKENWKIPFGYFLVDGVSGSQRASLVLQCLQAAHEANIDIVSLTCNGCPENVSMLEILGASLNITDFRTSFPHPVTKNNVVVFLDACHMLKLVRNCFEFKKILIDKDGNEIDWNYLEKLKHIQTEETSHLGRKSRKQHFNFYNNKMEIRYSTQFFSKSIANALSFCKDVLKMEQFQNVDATVKFIVLINDLFDVLNSKNLGSLNFKAPLNSHNKEKIFLFLDEAKQYLFNLKTIDNVKIIESGRRMGFLGFCCCIDSTKTIFQNLVELEKEVENMAMYKISLDHLELFFCNIRQLGRFNNVPTSRQFQSAYKKLLLHKELKEPFLGKCFLLQNIFILCCNSSIDKINLTSDRYRSLNVPANDNEEYLFNISSESLHFSEYSKYIITYIAGFVSKSLIKQLKCEDCLKSLTSESSFLCTELIFLKDPGGFIYPSKDVATICQEVEKFIKVFLKGEVRVLPKLIREKIVHNVLKFFLGKNIFSSLHYHQYENFPFDSNHIIQLIRAVGEKYLDVRINHSRKVFNSVKATKRLF